ncbi:MULTISPECIES: IclR family transcriptional regulator [unclassified Vibrio]|uniref:HTH-type transcriptional repressor AllR n=1 Tax=Vibrio sp. HB236076 TaxID=3232307 RepID=A0AB39HHV8_9VIBR|nr:IclR family transcriptional regulator [Vibrio sp. HB161653]MDP5253267.1 IclR family transcriptional regulator [Vibrio sp. HB161653]
MTGKHKISSGAVNEKALQLLMQVAINPHSLTAKELADQVNQPLSSLYRYLKILKEWSLIEETPHEKRLAIGPAALMLMRSYQTTTHTSDLDAVLTRLQKQTGELAAYMVPVGYRALCVSMKESMQALRCSFVQGQSQPLLRGASSKVMLAYMPSERSEKILRYFNEGHQLEQWKALFEQIRVQGYAMSHAEIDHGVASVSAPVLKGSKLIGAISVMAPLERVKANKQKIILHVLQASRALPPEG